MWANGRTTPHTLVRTATIVNSDFEIPPHAANHVVEADMDIPHDATIYSFTPHMHYRGKSMDFCLTYPDGIEEPACSIPNYDFNWQLDDMLKEPLKVPAGTNLRIVGVFDNSAANPYNPDPSKSVRWGGSDVGRNAHGRHLHVLGRRAKSHRGPRIYKLSPVRGAQP